MGEREALLFYFNTVKTRKQGKILQNDTKTGNVARKRLRCRFFLLVGPRLGREADGVLLKPPHAKASPERGGAETNVEAEGYH
jgi:hypothetical protein